MENPSLSKEQKATLSDAIELLDKVMTEVTDRETKTKLNSVRNEINKMVTGERTELGPPV